MPVEISRRQFLRMSGAVAAASVLGSCGKDSGLVSGAPPNIIFFLADDQRNDTLGCTGDRIVKTPRIDALASAGTIFENMFVTTSICPSSRATIFTGVTETKHRFTFGTPPLSKFLCQSSYPALLKKAGYHTGVIGKFGVAMDGDIQKTFVDQFEDRDRPYTQIMPDGTKKHIDEINVESALKYLKGCQSGQPFLLSLNFSSPHAEDSDREHQYHPIDWAKDMYADVVFPPPKINDKEYFETQPDFLKHSMNRERYMWRFDTPEKYQKNMRDYYRMLSGVDHMVGIVIDELARLNLLDNSVVFYAADNGYYMGDRGFADKFTHYEESLRVPLIMADFRPHRAAPTKVGEMALNVDIPATFLELAGVDRPAHYQGRSLLSLVNRTSMQGWRKDFFCQHTMNEPTIPKWVGVRSERYMYACYYEQSPPFEFLHDLVKDPTEFKNLASDPAYASALSEQRARCDALRQSLS
ncbi:Tat (twin-arginine translocation) pathway signal sequence [Dyella sp. OK004]|uniref:sulfatase-like hydrolase/transferase n=1 Tax=Dyella sp. OK004 TaxID=1855292 RepID=UPI0008EEBA63|nr:sulfatase-like hydrolase/transferase [Dyella sp. OK004]SFR93636.1 Tat (twin-arginine translocation) pathway signal sequence [Dyella sp. OK004]